MSGYWSVRACPQSHRSAVASHRSAAGFDRSIDVENRRPNSLRTPRPQPASG